MKNMRKLAIAVCLSMAVTMFASCAPTTEQTKEKKETEAVTEEVTEEPTKAPEEPTDVPDEPLPSDDIVIMTDVILDDASGDARYAAYLDFATKLHEENADLRFTYYDNYNTTPVSFCLQTYDPATGTYTIYFCSDDGEMNVEDSYTLDEIYRDGAMSYTCSYDAFMQIPCMCLASTDGIADRIDDGRYFGSIVAVSENADELLIYAGKQISLSEEEFLALKPGDKIEVGLYDYDYMTVVSVDESKTDGDRVEFDSEYMDIWFTQGGKYAENDTDFILMSSNDCPVYSFEKLTRIHIASDCEIDDHGFAIYTMPEGYQENAKAFAELMGLDAPFASSACFYYSEALQDLEFRYESSNGWIPVYGFLWPFEVTNGQISSMYIDLR